ncbi:hypothetical protein DM01DRAFT_1335535 [Hesseltinella vesiculosa]|uniref:Uncharacterized protein n=1 Tax=Hesseltinella vesiculosa TaxID=101127 RepID=A0A1X2GI70_9FUNG|nr:hypothetical protein DM01DRAFT_1335535 [Hesseltinella vesiculosa]
MSSWFYIQNTITGQVISASKLIDENGLDPQRSQVHIYPCRQVDAELWAWDGPFIRNKATDLVLDVRKGRLRLIEDTEICLYPAKNLDQAQNQQWTTVGHCIHAVAFKDWVLMQVDDKLVLYPHEPSLFDPDHANTWQWVPEQEWSSATYTTPVTMPALSSSADTLDSDFPKGLTPAKRGSQGSVHTVHSLDHFKDFHDRLFIEHDAHLSDKAMSMAIAYHTWSNTTLQPIQENESEGRDQLLEHAQQQVKSMLTQDQHHHKEDTVLHLTTKYIHQLCDNKICS